MIWVMKEARRLFSNSLIVFAGTITASIFSYLYNMLMGRMLGPRQYGEMTAIMSLLAVVGVGAGALVTVVMRYSSELYHQKHYLALRKLTQVFTKFVFLASVILFLLGIIFSRQIQLFFAIEHILPVIIAFVSLLFGLVIFINRGVLQGTQQFAAVSIIGVIEMFLRLCLAVGLVWLGLEINGAITAIVLATVVAYFLTTLPLKKILSLAEQTNDTYKFNFDKKEILGYSMPTLLTTLFLVVSINLDIFLVKHYFPAEQAGTYAAVSTVAKIILYMTAPIIIVMFPIISELRTKQEKHYKTFLLSLVFTLVSVLLILMVYRSAPSFVLKVLYGEQYVGSALLLPQVGLMVVFYSLINLMANYFMAIKNFVFLWFSGFVLIGQVVLVTLYHSSLSQVINILTLTLTLLFVLMILYYLLTKQKQLEQLLRGYSGREH